MLQLLAQATQAATQPTTQAVTLEFSAPLATLISSLLLATVGLLTVIATLLNWRHQSIATRYKLYLESYKLAKDTGIATPNADQWAKDILVKIEDDLTHSPFRTVIIYGYTLYAWAAVGSLLIYPTTITFLVLTLLTMMLLLLPKAISIWVDLDKWTQRSKRISAEMEAEKRLAEKLKKRAEDKANLQQTTETTQTKAPSP